MFPNHSFGGSALDRYVYDYEIDAGDGGDAAQAAPVTAEPAVEAAAPVVEPGTDLDAGGEQQPQYLTAEQAAEIADARLNALLTQYVEPTEQQQDPGELFDLNPLDENFGQNLLTMLSQRDEFMLGKMQELFRPMQSRIDREATSEGEARVNEIVDKLDLGDPAKDAVKQLAPVFLAETGRLYGQGTPRSAEAALQKAGALITAIEQDAFKRGQGQNATHLNALAEANREPGTNGAAVSIPEAGSVQEALERWQSRNTSNLTAA